MANNSKFDAQVGRIQYLMGYNNSLKEGKSSTNVECHAQGADGKVYGIIREGNMYYIKTTTPGKENLKESYEYIGGFNYRGENGYKGYNEASKHLELKLRSLNESYGKNTKSTIFDSTASKRNYDTLTEAARTELDRMHQILENSNVIGMKNVGDPESKGKASDPAKQGDPFEILAQAKLDKDPKFNGSVENAMEHEKPADADKQLQSDKMVNGKRGDEDYSDAHDDLDGEGVADKKPAGGKAVMVNEEEIFPEENPDEPNEELGEIGEDDYEKERELRRELGLLDNSEEEDENDDLDSLLNEFINEDEDPIEEKPIEEEECIEGPNKVLDGPHGKLPVQTMDRLNESIDRIVNKVCKKVLKENFDDFDDFDDFGYDDDDEENLKNNGLGSRYLRDYLKHYGGLDRIDSDEVPLDYYDLPEDTDFGDDEDDDIYSPELLDDEYDGEDELVGSNMVSESGVCPKCGKTPCECDKKGCKCKCDDEGCKCNKKEELQEAIDRMVAEEIHNLNVWGKHPRYRRQPMSTPEDREVIVNHGDRDWNDDSAKGSQAFGQKIGSGAPFDILVDKVLKDVVKRINESKKA